LSFCLCPYLFEGLVGRERVHAGIHVELEAHEARVANGGRPLPRAHAAESGLLLGGMVAAVTAALKGLTKGGHGW
jgi:hypothetical protein